MKPRDMNNTELIHAVVRASILRGSGAWFDTKVGELVRELKSRLREEEETPPRNISARPPQEARYGE